MTTADPTLDVTIITGMSGAGRSEAAHVLEDLGFFVIDNLPPMLIGKVAELARGHETPTRYALVVDVRSGDFLHDLSAAVDELHRQGVTTRILYLDANDEVLVRRYEESRRRHPMSDTDRVSDGIQRERTLLEPLVAEADLRVDTSTLNVHELRDRFASCSRSRVPSRRCRSMSSRSVTSTGCRSTSISCSTAASCRTRTGSTSCARSPGSTRPCATTCSRSAARVSSSTSSIGLFALLVPGYEREGKSYLSVALGCTGGRHRSVVIGEQLAQRFRRLGHRTAVHHRDVDRA